MIEGLHHVAVIISRREHLALYRLLGFAEVSAVFRPDHHDELIMMQGHGLTLEIFVDGTHPARLTGPEANGLRHLALRVTEPEKLRDFLISHGYEPENVCTDPAGGRFFFVKDPDGCPIEFHE